MPNRSLQASDLSASAHPHFFSRINFILTLFVAYVLLQSFHQRNLKPAVRRKLTLIALASELHLGLICVAAPAPWVARGSPSS